MDTKTRSLKIFLTLLIIYITVNETSSYSINSVFNRLVKAYSRTEPNKTRSDSFLKNTSSTTLSTSTISTTSRKPFNDPFERISDSTSRNPSTSSTTSSTSTISFIPTTTTTFSNYLTSPKSCCNYNTNVIHPQDSFCRADFGRYSIEHLNIRYGKHLL